MGGAQTVTSPVNCHVCMYPCVQLSVVSSLSHHAHSSPPLHAEVVSVCVTGSQAVFSAAGPAVTALESLEGSAVSCQRAVQRGE